MGEPLRGSPKKPGRAFPKQSFGLFWGKRPGRFGRFAASSPAPFSACIIRLSQHPFKLLQPEHQIHILNHSARAAFS